MGLSSLDKDDEDDGEGDRTITPSRPVQRKGQARTGRRLGSGSSPPPPPPPLRIDFDQIEDEAQARGITMDDVLRERGMFGRARSTTASPASEINMKEIHEEAQERGISMAKVLEERGIDPDFPEDLDGLDGIGHGMELDMDMTRAEVEEQRARWMRMRSEVEDSSDHLGSYSTSTPQRTARERARMIAISGLSPVSPSAGRSGSARPGMGHGEEDMDVDMDEEVGGSPSVRASRKRQGRVGLSDFGSSEEEVGRVAKAPKIRVSAVCEMVVGVAG